MVNTIESAKTGETFKVTFPGANPRTVDITVGPPCDSKKGGQWYCATHNQFFVNQFDKDSHIHSGKHKLIWNCFEHGLEQP